MDDVERLADLIDGGTVLVVDGVHALVRLGEAEIARRGLLGCYAVNLCDVMELHIEGGDGNSVPWDEVGLLLTAPPEVRVRAMLQVLGVSH
jgi:hypothetical protein